MGFTGAEKPGLLTDSGVEFDPRGNVARDAAYQTSVPGVFVAGDMGRGQSLIVWAIAEGRSAAAAVDQYLRALDRPGAPGRRSRRRRARWSDSLWNFPARLRRSREVRITSG